MTVPNPSGYADPLLEARTALARFEEHAAQHCAGHAAHLPRASAQAGAAVLACRHLLVWCEREAWAPIPEPQTPATG